jgi:uncharacterized RDD family membrane protein YckC
MLVTSQPAGDDPMSHPRSRHDMIFASRGARLFGQLVDAIVASTPMVVVVLLDTFDIGFRALGMVAVLFSIGYYLLADGLAGGQSVAKRWLGMAVVDAQSGAPCTFGQSFVRNLLLAILGPLDWLFIFGGRHQRLGDKAAGTMVVVAG